MVGGPRVTVAPGISCLLCCRSNLTNGVAYVLGETRHLRVFARCTLGTFAALVCSPGALSVFRGVCRLDVRVVSGFTRAWSCSLSVCRVDSVLPGCRVPVCFCSFRSTADGGPRCVQLPLQRPIGGGGCRPCASLLTQLPSRIPARSVWRRGGLGEPWAAGGVVVGQWGACWRAAVPWTPLLGTCWGCHTAQPLPGSAPPGPGQEGHGRLL